MRRIAVFTSGGDAPGMNANVRAVVRDAVSRKITVVGIERGYQGLLDGRLRELGPRDVGGILARGGTFLRTARCAGFLQPEGRARAARVLREHRIDGLVGCGGDGTFHGLQALRREHGFAVVGTPGTIDNDVLGTDRTIGFSTAVQTAVEACDRIRDTADSHDRVFVVEVMGRHCGWIALQTALSAGAEVVLLPERPDLDLAHCCRCLEAGGARGKRSMLVITAEGAFTGEQVAEGIRQALPRDSVRVSVLGHMLRGGSPVNDDRLVATLTGAGAVEALLRGDHEHHIGVVANQVTATPLDAILDQRRPIDDRLVELVQAMAS